MEVFNLQVPFFRPVWRRILVVAICLGWAGFEFATGATFWGMIFSGMGIYALWQLFLRDWPQDTGGA